MDAVNEIKQKLDIVNVIGSYVSLKKSGNNYKGLCPFHGEKTASFMVSQELQLFKCFGCAEGGDMFKFVEKMEGVDFIGALKILADKAGVVLETFGFNPDDKKKKIIYEINHLTAEFYHYVLLKHVSGKLGLDYVKKKRRLNEKIIKDFKIGYAPDTWNALHNILRKRGYTDDDLLLSGVIVKKNSGDGFIDRFRGRIIFPLTGIDGKIIGFTGRTIFDNEPKYLNTTETPVFHKSSFVYALDKAKVFLKKDGAVFVEGQVDVITAHQAGISNVVASSGTSLTLDQLKIISRYTRDITFCFDSDSAGQNALYRAISLAEKENLNVKIAVIPKPYKDLDELLNVDPEAAKKVLTDPISAYDYLFFSILKKYDKTSYLGKKKITEELTHVFSEVKNLVIKDHYIKKTSQELDLSEAIVTEIFSQKASLDVFLPSKSLKTLGSYPLSTMEPKKQPQEYLLSLFFKAPIDMDKSLLYKLQYRDFPDNKLYLILEQIQKYLHENNQIFDIKKFVDTIEGDLKDLVNEMYLWDLGIISDDSVKLLNEINITFARVRKDTLKRELKELTKKIKQADQEKNAIELQELSEKFKKLSEEFLKL